MPKERIKTLEKTDAQSWGYVPDVLSRIETFIKEIGSDYPVKQMQGLFLQSLIADEPAVKVMVALDENGAVVGHLIGALEQRFGYYYLAIMQYSLDRSVPRELLKDAFDAMCEWARKYGITEVYLTTIDEKRVRMFRQFWGFELHRFTMKRAI